MTRRNLLTFVVALLAVFSVSAGAFAQKEAAPSPAPAKTKKMPARDPKTGRFVKSGGATKMTGKSKMGGTKKPLPPRDAKGRFMKKAPAAAPNAPTKP